MFLTQHNCIAKLTKGDYVQQRWRLDDNIAGSQVLYVSWDPDDSDALCACIDTLDEAKRNMAEDIENGFEVEIWDEEVLGPQPQPRLTCPFCDETFPASDHAMATSLEDHGMCQDCHTKWQNGEYPWAVCSDHDRVYHVDTGCPQCEGDK